MSPESKTAVKIDIAIAIIYVVSLSFMYAYIPFQEFMHTFTPRQIEEQILNNHHKNKTERLRRLSIKKKTVG